LAQGLIKSNFDASPRSPSLSMLDDDVRIPLGHPPLLLTTPGAKELVDKLVAHLGWPLGSCRYGEFQNGELSFKLERTVANHDVFILCIRDDLQAEVNFRLMQLLMLIDAVKGESPHKLTVVLPCLEYARQDRRLVAGEAIPPRLLLRCMRTAGADRFLVIDLHNQAMTGFSPENTVVDELSAEAYLADFVRTNVVAYTPEKLLVCATNGGGLRFTRRVADELGAGFLMADRFRPTAGAAKETRIISHSQVGDVEAIVIVDDIFDTCGTLVEAACALRSWAPRAKLYAVATHGFFSAEAQTKIQKLVEDTGLQWIAVTNSIAPGSARARFESVGLQDHLQVIDISRLIAGAILRIHLGASVNVPSFRSLGPRSVDEVLQASQLQHMTSDAEMGNTQNEYEDSSEPGSCSDEQESSFIRP